MKIRIGVVGPQDSIEQIMKAGKHFKELELDPFVYKQTEETEDIINQNRDSITQWFFSGQAPYYYALSKGLITEEEGSFTPLNGSSLLGTLLEAFVKEGRILKHLSLDTLQVDEVEKVKDYFSLDGLSIHSNSYAGYLPAEEIIDFHRKLYTSGKIDAAITCIKSVYVALKEMGVPVYRVVPSELAVHRALGLIKERAQSSWYRKSQLVIVGVEVIYAPASGGEHPFSFKVKHQELELKRVLLDFVEKINGSIVQVGDGLFYIYTTRGELELFTKRKSIQLIIDECYVNSQLSVRIGIGYGQTVLAAEEHVRIAFDYAREEEGPVVITINEDKAVSKYLDGNEQVAYQTRNKGMEWERIFKNASISSSLAAKIESLAYHYEKSSLSSQDLARWLKSTERNARRILAEMERIGVAKVIGEESTGRGRPRKVYELTYCEEGVGI
ncbi:hypothetical protein [Alkalihalobacillus sp. AL-G]|uniref:hypothetical protein n=1 Tax=Alkalihalobacillus sp. AL-G TaxID=2926399 RepID=UPI00272D933A|nr:hypothetical protein [Alkalihalobacillus sp. AL-G]WLD93593.1 hypothetical protein MOJ78_01245 [Alkalihalobacillus sp. AL-G]